MNDNNSGDLLSQWKPSTPEEVRDAFREVRRLADLADFAPDRLIREVKRHLRPNPEELSVLTRWDAWFARNLPESKIAKELPSLVRLLGRIASGKPAAGKPYSETLRYWAETLEPLLLEFVRGAPERRWYPGCEMVQLAQGLEASIKRQVESITSWVTLFGTGAPPASEGTNTKSEPGISKVESAQKHPKQTASEGKKPIKLSKETIRRFQALRDKEKMSWPKVERKHGDGCSQRNLRRLASEIGYDIEKKVFAEPLSELASALLEVEEKKAKKNER